MTDITLQQKIWYYLSFWSNAVSDYYQGTQAELEAKLNQAIQTNLQNNADLIGAWEIAWGPCVFFKADSDQDTGIAANAMYVAQKPGTAEYVVAIAGSNFVSPYSIAQDCLVGGQDAWNTFAPSTAAGIDAKIAQGTGLGLQALLGMSPASGYKQAGKTLVEFFRAATATTAVNITVTGLSLGGALSPAMALYLHDERALWDQNGHSAITVMPMAGPTPGNGAFTQYYDNSPVGQQTIRYVNTLDIVPHAWNLATLEELKTLYQGYIPDSEIVNGLVDWAMDLAADGDYTIIANDSGRLEGTFNEDINVSKIPFVNYIAQAGFQHIDGYQQWFGIDGVTTTPPEAGRFGDSRVLASLWQKEFERIWERRKLAKGIK